VPFENNVMPLAKAQKQTNRNFYIAVRLFLLFDESRKGSLGVAIRLRIEPQKAQKEN